LAAVQTNRPWLVSGCLKSVQESLYVLLELEENQETSTFRPDWTTPPSTTRNDEDVRGREQAIYVGFIVEPLQRRL
jgi:hypothetical protein